MNTGLSANKGNTQNWQLEHLEGGIALLVEMRFEAEEGMGLRSSAEGDE